MTAKPTESRADMETANEPLGTVGEELAFQFLLKQGYKILIRNYACNLGEIDLIGKEGGQLVFIEVKTRRSDSMGAPSEALTFQKRRHIVNTAKAYIQRYGIQNMSCRFDVVSILMPLAEEPVIGLIRDAFGEGR